MNHIMGESSIGGRDWTMFPLHGRTTPRVQLTALADFEKNRTFAFKEKQKVLRQIVDTQP